MAIYAFLEEKGKTLPIVLDFVEVAESHSGENLCNVLHKTLIDFGIEKKVCTISMKVSRLINDSPALYGRCQQHGS